jgi:hypothetical protein
MEKSAFDMDLFMVTLAKLYQVLEWKKTLRNSEQD